MIKKTLCVILSVIVILGNTYCSFADFDNTHDYSDTDLKKYIYVLERVGVIPKESITVEESNETVTRARFAKMLLGLINGSDFSENRQYFSDVSDCPEANVLAALGVFRGREDGKFFPDEAITNFEARVAVLRLLGYDPYVTAHKMSFAQTAAYAARLGIEGGKEEHNLNVGELAEMLYNSLEIEVYYITSYSEDGAEYTQSDNRTVLSTYFDTTVETGTITANRFSTLTGDNGLGEGMIAVNDVQYSSDVPEADEYLGMEVKTYIQKSADGLWRVIAVTEESNNEFIEIKRDDIISYKNFVLQYADSKSGKQKSITLSKSSAMVFNGVAVSGNYEAVFKFADGVVRIGKNRYIGEGYNVVLVESFDTATITSRDAVNSIIYTDRTDKLRKIEFDNPDKIVEVYDLVSGRQETYLLLRPGYILTVKQSMDEKYTVVYICREHVEGQITSVNSQNREIMINGVKYKIAPDYELPTQNILGRNGKFYLNAFGKICGSTDYELSDNKIQAYMYALKDDKNKMSDNISVKLFDINGNFHILPFAKKINMDGKTEDEYSAKAKLTDDSGKLIRQMVIFGTNSSGKINYIDTAAENSDAREDNYTLYCMAEKSNYTYSDTQHMFWPLYPLQELSTVVMMIPKTSVESPDEENFAVAVYKKDSMFVAGGSYNVSMYKTDDETPFVDTVLYEMDEIPAFHYFPSVMVIDEVVNTLEPISRDSICGISGYYMTRNSTKRVPEKIDFYTGDSVMISYDGKTYNTVSSEQLSSILNEGDIIQYQCNTAGKIVRILVIYDYSEDKCYWGDSYQNCDVNVRKNDKYTMADVEKLYVNDSVSNAQIMITLGKNGVECEEISMYPSYFKAIVFDNRRRNDKIYQGTLDDIVSRENTGSSECSKLFVWRLDMFYQMFVVYR